MKLKQTVLAVLDAVRDEGSKDAPVRLVFEPEGRTVGQQELITMPIAQTSLETSAPIYLHTGQAILDPAVTRPLAALPAVSRRPRVRITRAAAAREAAVVRSAGISVYHPARKRSTTMHPLPPPASNVRA